MNNLGCIIIHSEGYINRKKYVDKLNLFFKEIPVTIIPGVITDKLIYNPLNNKILSKGETGCALAHLNALKLAIDNNYDYIFIFEDDVEIIENDYSVLYNWLKNLPEYDICLITYVNSFQGTGHDGRIHKDKIINNVNYTTCPFGTQAYFCRKEIIHLLYNTQMKLLNENKIHIADGLHIHCKKPTGDYLNIITNVDKNKFFKHANEISLVKH